MISVLLILAIIFGIVVLFLIGRFAPKPRRRLNHEHFQKQWLEILARVKTSDDGMTLAVIDADKLVDEALRKLHFGGKTMGERLVSAQRTLSNNDNVWYAHKLRNRLVHEPNVQLKKREAQDALTGFRQALRDLGAL
ncbi:MAG: hypothetical protein ABSD10_01400 [Candidatus Saccharimonadales bacterium]|jgi:hypothetical protein